MVRMSQLKIVSILVIVAFSCSSDRYEFTELPSSMNEILVDSYFEDLEDMTATVLAAEPGATTGSRKVILPSLDQRLSCAGIIDLQFLEGNSADVPHGQITIIYTSGCGDAKGNMRKGRIDIEFKGKRFQPGSTVTTTQQDYTINGVAINGKRVATCLAGSTEEHPVYTVDMAGGTATFPDGSKSNRSAFLTREWIRNEDPKLDQWKVTGTAQGLGRYSLYDMKIIEPVVYKRECALGLRVFMAVQGKKQFNVKGSEYILDYGSGDCDKSVQITSDRRTTSFEMLGNY